MYLLVYIDNHSGWPYAFFLPNSTTDKVIEFLLKIITKNGITERIRTDTGTACKSEKKFCKEKFIEHNICPVRDHDGNGNVERMIRTIKERLRTYAKFLISKDKRGISNIFFALRSEKGPDGKSAFERQNGRKPNTEKSRMIEQCILDQDPGVEIEQEDFSEEADSTTLVRERVRGTKLEGAFNKVNGQIVDQSSHTITILPTTGRQVVYSKRDVATNVHKASSSKVPSPSKEPSGNKSAKNKRKASEIKEKSVNREKRKEKAVKLKTMLVSQMGLMPQECTESDNDVDVQIKNE